MPSSEMHVSSGLSAAIGSSETITFAPLTAAFGSTTNSPLIWFPSTSDVNNRFPTLKLRAGSLSGSCVKDNLRSSGHSFSLHKWLVPFDLNTECTRCTAACTSDHPRRHHIVYDERKNKRKQEGERKSKCSEKTASSMVLEWYNAAAELNTMWSVSYYTSCVDVMRCCAYAHRLRKAARFRSTHKKIRINNRSYVRRDNSRIQQNWRQSQSVSIVSTAQSSMLAKSFGLVHVRKCKREANSGMHRRKTLGERKTSSATEWIDFSGKRPTHKNEKLKTKNKRRNVNRKKSAHLRVR